MGLNSASQRCQPECLCSGSYRNSSTVFENSGLAPSAGDKAVSTQSAGGVGHLLPVVECWRNGCHPGWCLGAMGAPTTRRPRRSQLPPPAAPPFCFAGPSEVSFKPSSPAPGPAPGCSSPVPHEGDHSPAFISASGRVGRLANCPCCWWRPGGRRVFVFEQLAHQHAVCRLNCSLSDSSPSRPISLTG